MSRESPKKRQRTRRTKTQPTQEADLRDAAIRAAERKRREAEREARALGASEARTYPLTTLGWLGVVVTFIALVTLLAVGAQSIWSWLYVLSSGIFSAILLSVGHQRGEVRFGLPLRTGTKNGLVTNVAVTLAVLQFAGGVVALGKEIVSGAPSSPTTIIQQRICPEGSHFVFPKERS
jgi:hypothetical protein